MGTAQSQPTGPDLARGIPVGDLPDGRVLAGHVGEDAVLLARRARRLLCNQCNLILITADCSRRASCVSAMSVMGHSRRFGFVRFRGVADMNS
jgi:hypothetical protein